MRVSCRGRYATRAMIELALHEEKKPISLKIIGKNQGIPKNFLPQVMGALKVAGLVVVIRGQKGGYLLARHPSEITLADILFSIEGDMSLVDCVKDQRLCYRSEECLAIPTWVALSQVIKDHLKSTTLADILKKGISQKAFRVLVK